MHRLSRPAGPRLLLIFRGVVALADYDSCGREQGVRFHSLDQCRRVHAANSEFVKIVLILLVASYLTDLKSEYPGLERPAGSWPRFVGLPMLLVMKEPDLGTSLTYIPILVAAS